jgi:hypothetical protein
MSESDWGSDVLFFGDDSQACQRAKGVLKEASIPFIDKGDRVFDQQLPQVHYGKYMWTGPRGIAIFIERWGNGTCRK